jgi:hypothetical protein
MHRYHGIYAKKNAEPQGVQISSRFFQQFHEWSYIVGAAQRHARYHWRSEMKGTTT